MQQYECMQMPKKRSIPKLILNSKPMDWRWIPYHMCKELTNMAGIQTFRQYRAWVRDYKPGGVPTRPEYVYKDWVDWQTFLETDNVYDADSPGAVRKENLMDYWEAVNLIQPLQLQTVDEYKEMYDAHNLPKGIPRRPDRRYPTFYANGGYKTWLGKDIKHRVEAKQQVKTLFILYRRPDTSSNALSILMYTKGYRQLINELSGQQIQVLKIYEWEAALSEHVFKVMDHYGTKQGEVSWLFNSIDVILYELGGILNEYQVK